MDKRITRTAKELMQTVYDYNGDEKINCIDHACLFKIIWDKNFPDEKYRCQIIRNKKDGVMHHLFIQIVDEKNQIIEIEPWVSNPNEYLMTENWDPESYDRNYNIYGETQIWLAENQNLNSDNDSSTEKNFSKTLHQSGVYGQSFELVEFNDGSQYQLLLYMSDNKTKMTTTYDLSMRTVYYIHSKWFSNSVEYSKTIEACKEFFDVSMNLIYLAEMKDICDIAPCCSLLNYKIAKDNNNEKYILIEFDCSNLELLFEIARLYNAKGRDYVLEKYLN